MNRRTERVRVGGSEHMLCYEFTHCAVLFAVFSTLIFVSLRALFPCCEDFVSYRDFFCKLFA